MFIGYIIANEVAYAVVQNAKDVLDAKNRCAKYINDNPTEFKNGYECYITDRSTHQVVSFATVPQPSLEWQDTKS